MSDSDRLDRIEAILVRLSDTMEAGFAGATQVMRVLKDQLMVLDGQMVETLGRLRIIGERLASHTHDEGG